MAAPGTSDSSSGGGNDSDQDFDLSVDDLVNDFDDEHTLEEEEALEDEDGNANEIDDLQRESEMPLEELLALYRYAPIEEDSESEKPNVTSTSNLENECDATSSTSIELPTSKLIKTDISKEDTADQIPESSVWISIKLDHLIDPTAELISDDSDEGDDDDDDVSEDRSNDWRKIIHVGSDFQANVPTDLKTYTSEQEYELGDQKLWSPGNLTLKTIEDYLKAWTDELSRNQKKSSSLTIPDSTLPIGLHVADDEKALFLLLQSEHDVELALRKKTDLSSIGIVANQMNPWSEEECAQFEEGVKLHGKDFFTIQRTKLPTRSVNELVHFYYLWKKTERHDLFVSRFREKIEKKKYNLHPGITDFMDKFVDEQENLALQAQSGNLNNNAMSNQKHNSNNSAALNSNLIGGDSSLRTPVSTNESARSMTGMMFRSNKGESYPDRLSSTMNGGTAFLVGPDSSSSINHHSSSSSSSNSVSSSTPGTSEM